MLRLSHRAMRETYGAPRAHRACASTGPSVDLSTWLGALSRSHGTRAHHKGRGGGVVRCRKKAQGEIKGSLHKCETYAPRAHRAHASLDVVADRTRREDEPHLTPGNAVGTATPQGQPSVGLERRGRVSETRGQPTAAPAQRHPPPCVTFRRVAVPLRGPGQSPVLPFACCVGSLRSVGRCGRCSCWCRFRVRGAPSLVCRGCAECGGMCRLRGSGAGSWTPLIVPPGAIESDKGPCKEGNHIKEQ